MEDPTGQETRVEWLQKELNIEKENVRRAAEIGKQLLEQNEDLEIRLESMQKDHVGKLQELEQEKYSLSMKLNVKEQIEKSLSGELEQVKESLQNLKETETILRQKETLQLKKIQELEIKVENLQTESENGNMMEEQLKEKIKHLEDTLEDSQQKLHQKQNVTFDDEELRNLYQENSALKVEKESLSLEVKHTKDILQQTTTSKESLEQKLETLRQDVEERERQATSYFNALEKSREEVTELKVQLDVATMQSVDTNQKGNSLFAEVDDRRKDHERKLITLKVQHDSLREQYNIKKQQLLKMKGQIAGLLQMSSYQADFAQIQRLQTALAQSRGEVKVLTDKLRNLEHLEGEVTLNKQLGEFRRQLSDETLGDQDNFIQFLEVQLKSCKKELGEVKRELQTQRLLRIEDSDKLWKTEKKLHQTESNMEKMRADSMRLHLKLEELRTKYGENDERNKQGILLGNVEKVPIRRRKKAESSGNCQDSMENDLKETRQTDTEIVRAGNVTNDAGVAPKKVKTSDNSVGCKNGSHGDGVETPDSGLENVHQTKKKVTMCEVVSVLNESGTFTEENIQEDCEAKDHGKTGKPESDGPEVTESKGRRRTGRRGGKQCQKVISSKDALVKNECNQQ